MRLCPLLPRSTAAIYLGIPALAATLIATPASAQDFDQVQIQTEQITPSLYMLVGAGGNIAVSVGEDGTFIVDDQYAPLTERIVAAIGEVTDDPVDFVINTHWHFDHTGGNENFGGRGAVIVSHENSRRRMQTDQIVELFDENQRAYSREGLPKITFDESVRFHLNGHTIDVIYLGRAHTDGDAVVYFREANVMHTGDVFVRYGFPFIDQPNGGSVDGIIDVVDRIANLTDGETVFVPGHGPLSRRADLLEYRAMVSTIRERVQALIDAGNSFEEVLAADPVEGYPERGIPTEAFLRLVYDSLRESG
jgi:glyoxylase-like metal-dependent hydrolase (beta-lactamase superfamily II)